MLRRPARGRQGRIDPDDACVSRSRASQLPSVPDPERCVSRTEAPSGGCPVSKPKDRSLASSAEASHRPGQPVTCPVMLGPVSCAVEPGRPVRLRAPAPIPGTGASRSRGLAPCSTWNIERARFDRRVVDPRLALPAETPRSKPMSVRTGPWLANAQGGLCVSNACRTCPSGRVVRVQYLPLQYLPPAPAPLPCRSHRWPARSKLPPRGAIPQYPPCGGSPIRFQSATFLGVRHGEAAGGFTRVLNQLKVGRRGEVATARNRSIARSTRA